MTRLRRKRLAMDIPVELHNMLKKYAALRNITITRYVLRSLIRTLKEEKS